MVKLKRSAGAWLAATALGLFLAGAAHAADPVPLDIFVSPEGLFGDITGDTYSYKLVGDAVGVKFNVIRGDFDHEDDKLSTIFASGNLPNIISIRSNKYVDDLGPRGLFVRLDDYINAGKMPHLKALMDARHVPWSDITSSDGHIYEAPQFSDVQFFNPALLMRADLAQECGVIKDKNNPGPGSVISTVDQLHAAFACEKDKLGGPVIAGRDGFANILPKWAAWFGSSINQYYNPATKTYEYGPLMARFRTMVDFFATLRGEGILNPDYATLTDAEWSAIHDAGKAGAALENAGWNYNRLRDKGIDPGKDFFVQSLTIGGERIQWPAPADIADGSVLVISAKSSQEQIDAAVKLIDFLYSDDGAQLIWYGKEGVDWKVGADGKACFLGTWLYRKNAHGYCDGKIPDTATSFISASLLDGNPLYRIYGYGWKGKWSGVDNPDVAPDRWNEVISQFTSAGSLTSPNPRIKLTPDEISDAAQTGTPLDTFVVEEVQKMVDAGKPTTDDQWKAFTDQVSSMGAQQVVDIYNAALARKAS